MRDIIEIKPDWLLEIAPHFFKHKDIFGEPESKKQQVKMPPRQIK